MIGMILATALIATISTSLWFDFSNIPRTKQPGPAPLMQLRRWMINSRRRALYIDAKLGGQLKLPQIPREYEDISALVRKQEPIVRALASEGNGGVHEQLYSLQRAYAAWQRYDGDC